MGKVRDKERKRKLSEAEEKRKVLFDEKKKELENQGYVAKDLTVGLVFANFMAFILPLPIFVPGMWLFIERRTEGGYPFHFTLLQTIIVFVSIILLVVIHELIHGLFWGIFAKSHFKAIEFGFIAEYVTPYCTCKEPLKKSQYILGGIMPGVLLGVVPMYIAAATANRILMFISIIMLFSAGGDMTILGRMLLHRSSAKEKIYIDHPYEGGVVVFER